MLLAGFTHKRWLLFFSTLLFSTVLPAQVTIEGNILKEDNDPVPFATIRLLNHTEGVMSDAAGFFSLHLHALKNADTLLISSVGYEPLKIPAQKALGKKSYVLKSFAKKMEPVVVRSFGKEDMAGAKTDIIGYFRGWNTNNTGGEIGRGIYVPHKEYLVSKVRFKIFSTCDTCIIRLRIREFNTGFPGKELLKDSVALIFYKARVADKTYDFDISKYNLILNKENIFVSFEVIKGSSGTSNCSLAFAGSDPGTYIYKPSGEGIWSMTNDYAIYMKVFFRYE
jgi:CarboxypepD_reg-like domain